MANERGCLARWSLLAVALVCLTSLARAQDAASEARGLRSAGRYGDAEAALDEALERQPGDAALLAQKAELLLELGRYGEAAETARKGGGDARCLTLLGESRLRVGETAEARAAAEAAIEAAPELERARYLLGLVHLRQGRRKGALAAFEWFFDHYALNDLKDPEALTLVAAASVRVAELVPDEEMDFHVTMKLLDKITNENPDYLPAYVVKGNLYLLVYQDQDAKKWFEKALAKNPRYPPALFGLAEQSRLRFHELEGVGRCEEALLTNPNHFESREYIARTRIGDSRYEDAKKELDAVLAVAPGRRRARGLLAVIDFCRGRRKEFDAAVKGLLEEAPRWSRTYRDLAEVLQDQRRFEEAAEWAKKATEVDPTDYLSWWILGRNLVNLGHEKEAKEALARSRAVDPFDHYAFSNPFRHNMSEVLGHLEEFVESRSDHFVLKIHVGENAVLSRYYRWFLEKSWRLLTEKYGFTPEGPILTEVFHNQSDFAARTIGLPGIGALGACFGKVITLDSPSAMKAGRFAWASTAHHEFAHVVTLQMSKGRVPRWFTEGLSVYEERNYAPWWERDMDRRLFDAFANDEIFPIATFNQEFRGPNVLFAYYLGGMMCEFMEEEFGFPKMLDMLRAYGEDEQTPQVLKEVLGVTPEEYDRRFKEWVGRYVQGWKLTPRWSSRTAKALKKRLRKSPKDLDALVGLAWARFQRKNTVDAMTWLGKAVEVAPEDPRVLLLRGRLARASGRMDKAKTWYGKFLATGQDDFEARLHLAQIREEEGDDEAAIGEYEAAKACFPRYAGPKNPYLEIARLRTGEGDLEGAMRELEAYIVLANTDLDHRLELADWYESRKEWKKLADVLTQVVLIYPLGEKSVLPVHVRLAGALRRTGDLEGAAREYEVAFELGVPPEDQPGTRVGLGEVYYLLGRTQDARFQAEAALEAEPDYAPAKELLERLK